jgi:myo-inositol-1(or 4)-monophosphatase
MFVGGDAPRWARLTGAVGRTYYGGDCYTYGLLALGHIDVVVDATMKIWDWAALAPVVEGAGGRLTDWEGKPMRPDGDGRTLAVGDPALLPGVLELLSA